MSRNQTSQIVAPRRILAPRCILRVVCLWWAIKKVRGDFFLNFCLYEKKVDKIELQCSSDSKRKTLSSERVTNFVVCPTISGETVYRNQNRLPGALKQTKSGVTSNCVSPSNSVSTL